MTPDELLAAATSDDWSPRYCVVCGEPSTMQAVGSTYPLQTPPQLVAIGWCDQQRCQDDRAMTDPGSYILIPAGGVA